MSGENKILYAFRRSEPSLGVNLYYHDVSNCGIVLRRFLVSFHLSFSGLPVVLLHSFTKTPCLLDVAPLSCLISSFFLWLAGCLVKQFSQHTLSI